MFRRRRWKSQRGWRSRKPTKLKKRRIFFFALVIAVFLSFQSFVFIERNLKPAILSVAKVRVKQMATQAINTAITEKISQATNFEKLIDWKLDRNGKVTGFMLNYAEHMKITADTVSVVQNTLNTLQKIPEHVPIGQAFDSAILSSFGPEIKVKFVPAGAVKVDLDTKQKDAGINMLLVEVFIRIMTEVTIIIPFDTEPELVSTEVPISYLLVVGDVPMYYFDNKGHPVDTPHTSDVLPPTLSLPSVSPESDSETAPESSPSSGNKAIPGEEALELPVSTELRREEGDRKGEREGETAHFT
ncbi:sporulation protein YunB [Marinicrinis sediminis]|uniref:Sporulation protein YunB n=1 Tax=Marinicrinis sediminis TaxID=1652465 RepID=A0ABW5R6W0_9BACL